MRKTRVQEKDNQENTLQAEATAKAKFRGILSQVSLRNKKARRLICLHLKRVLRGKVREVRKARSDLAGHTGHFKGFTLYSESDGKSLESFGMAFSDLTFLKGSWL